MKTYFKRGLYLLVLTLSYYQSFSQTDTLCGKKTNATVNLVYGTSYNAYSNGYAADLTAAQPIATTQNMINSKYKLGIGVWSAWQLPPSPPTLFASQGDFKDRIKLTWEINPLSPRPTGFVLYRDGSFLANLDEDTKEYLDFFAQAGEFYQYSIAAKNAFGQGSTNRAVGFLYPNGVVSGKVTTTSGNAVPGVEVRLTPLTGNSMAFDGISGQLCVSYNSQYPNKFPTTAFTISTYVKLPAGTNTNDEAGIIDWGSTLNKNWWITTTKSTEGKGFIFHIGNGTGSDTLKYIIPVNNSTLLGNDEKWHQITMMFNGTTMSVLVDGDFIGTKPASIVRESKQRMTIGSKINSAYFKGLIDDIRIYNRTLTQTEVNETKNRSISKTEKGLAAYFKMDEGLGNKTFDTSLPTAAFIYGGATFSADKPEVYNAGISDETGFYMIDGVNYSTTENFRASPMKNFEFNTALEFNAADKAYGNLTNFSIPDTATIEVLFHPFDTKSRQTILSKENLFELYLNNEELFLKINNGVATNLGIIKAKYYLVSVVMNKTKGTGKVYIDDTFKTDISFTGNAFWDNGKPWIVATNDTTTNGKFYTGLIDEVAIFKKYLSLPEIQLHSTVGIPNDSTRANLFSYFDFNEGTDTKVYDYFAVNANIGQPRIGNITKASWSNNVRRRVSNPHEFEPNVRVVNLNKSNTAIGNIDFRDVSTVSVSGTVRFANTFCFEDSVEILVNGKSALPQIITNKKGEWSADFEPGINVRLSPYYKGHLFSPEAVEFRKLQTPKAGVVFLDNTVRSIKVQVAGGICKKSIIPNRSNYAVVSVKTLDGCFVKTDTIFNSDGIHIFKNLPARAFSVNVVSYSSIPEAMGQFNLQGKLVDLRNIQKDSVDFIYYAPLQVEASPIASAYRCSTLDDIAVLKFLQLSTTTIKVFEEYFGERCYSNDATIILKNGISNLPDSTDRLKDGKFVYQFRCGPVNITPPYTKKLEVRAKVGSREGVLTNPIQAIVLGEKSRGGNTFTSTSNPIILDILRDPPDDQGYAWREAGTKNCVNFSTSVSKNEGDNEGFFLNVGPKFDITVGLVVATTLETEVIANTTNTWTKNKKYSNNVTDQVCYTNNTVISTSTGDDYVGRDGDLYIGTTTNMVWGMSDKMDWDSLNCKVKITSKLSVDNSGFNSQFTYSTRYLENILLPELIKLSKLTTNRQDSLQYLDTYRSWRKIIAKEDSMKVIGYNTPSKILTLDAGASYQETTTLDSSADKSYNYSDEYNFDSANSLGVIIGGIGGSFNFGFNYNVTSEGSQTVNESSTNTYGYLIADNDGDDAHAIGVLYPNSVQPPKYNFGDSDASTINSVINGLNNGYNYDNSESVFSQTRAHHKSSAVVPKNNYKAPIFTLYAGSTSCPYEGGRPRERVNYSSDVSQLINVPANTQAVYRLSLGNESPTEETRTYLVKLVNESNPYGAIVKINGQLITATAVPFTVKYGQPQTVTMTIEKGPQKYNYDGIKIAYYSECEYNAIKAKNDSLFAIKDTVGISYKFYQELSFDTHFIEPCSPVNIGSPLQDWVVTPASLNNLNITLTEYNRNDANLKQVLVQYRPIGGDGSWTNISIIPKTNLTDVFTQYQWNTQLFRDGSYEIRAVAECTDLSLAPGISTVIKGEIARSPPELVGLPQPADGIWDPGDEISITFNEPINCDKVIPADILGNNTIGLYDATTNALVPATFTCVGSKIVIVPTINPKDYENKTFRVKVSGKDYDDAQIASNPNYQRGALRDKTGNMIPESIIWEFAVNQNSLEWVGNDIIETNVVLNPFSVKRQIRNRGGTIMQFRMEDLPFWLTITPSTGTLNPGQTADITFTFQQDMLIGDYLTTINMVGSQGKEPLLIDYRVRCPQPEYEVSNPEQYEGTMNMVVDLSIFGMSSMDPSDVIVAKIGGQIRGVGKVAYYRNIPADRQRWLTFLTIYGNPDDEDKPIEFTIWDGSKCNQYVEILENYTYRDGSLVGSPLVPTPVSVLNLVKKCIPLNRGFNWVSFNLNLGTGRNTVTNVLSSLNNKTGAYIKTDNSFAEYLPNYGWDALDSLIYPTKRYMVFVSGRDTVCIKGSPYEAGDYPIAIKNSWNWIGYVPSTGMTVTQALRGLTPLNGDIIKSQTLFAQYVAGVGWIGNLSFLEPLKGYLLKISNAGTLTYPTTNALNSGFTGSPGLSEKELASGLKLQSLNETPMTFDYTQYEQTMNLIGKVNGMTIDDEDELRAYIGGVLVGTNKAIATIILPNNLLSG